MSTNIQPKQYWIGYTMAVLFLIVGLGTVLGMGFWLPHAPDLATGIVGCAGIVIGILEIVEGVRLLLTSLKYKKITSLSNSDK